MVQYVFTGASLAASATSNNYFAGDRVQVAPYARTIQGIAVIARDNTPALDDMSWELYAGSQLLATGQNILARTGGSEVTNPDDYTTLSVMVPGNVNLQLKVINNDSGGAHTARVYLLMSQI